jgi:RHS repeat-associated protein
LGLDSPDQRLVYLLALSPGMSDEIGIPVALLSITVKNDGFGTSLEDFPSRISVLMLSAEIPGRTNPPPRCVESRSPGKERDAESGLDNFGARYFGSSLGRFETPDPLPWLGWQRGNSRDRDRFAAFIGNPQNLNLYAYVDNNPLNRTDPTGMYICKGDAQQCQAVQNSLDAVKRAADTLSKGTDKEQALAKKLNGILGFYGKAGIDNGVKVGFADLSGAGQVGKTSTSSFFGLFKTTTITFDFHAFSHSYAFGAETAAHEGAHGADGPIATTFFGTPKWSSVLGTETHAYQAEAAVDRGLGMNTASDGNSPVWNTGWGAAAEANSANAINANATSNAVASCAASGGCDGQP